MNPFDLRGPEFLAFYLMLGVLVTVALLAFRRRAEEASGAPPARLLTDYLDIAFLRGGAEEALRVATLSLVGRGLLKVVDGDRLQTRDTAAVDLAQKATERQLLRKFSDAGSSSSIFNDTSLRTIVNAACEPTLARLGLLPNDEVKSSRRSLFLAAALVLLGTAGIKIAVALSRGRSNIIFLVILAVVFLVVAFKTTHPRRTKAGDAMISDLKKLFAAMPKTASSKKSSSRTSDASYASSATDASNAMDVPLLGAVFGLAAMQEHMPDDTRKLFPAANSTSSDSSSGSSCGSSGCGSSSSSSCGGGSGCGGGGGCGGCGS